MKAGSPQSSPQSNPDSAKRTATLLGDLKAIAGHAERIGKCIGLIGMAVYAIGLMSTCLYYGPRGIQVFELVNSAYVLTGIAFCLPALLSGVGLKLFRELRKAQGLLPALIAMVVILVIAFISYAIIVEAGGMEASFGKGDFSPNVLRPVVFILAMAGISLLGWNFVRILWTTEAASRLPLQPIAFDSNKHVYDRVFALAGIVFLFGIYGHTFLSGLMPELSSVFGGGATRPVRFVISPGEGGKAHELSVFGIESQSVGEGIDLPGHISPEFQLLYASNESYFIQIGVHGFKEIYSFPKSRVQGVVFLKRDEANFFHGRW